MNEVHGNQIAQVRIKTKSEYEFENDYQAKDYDDGTNPLKDIVSSEDDGGVTQIEPSQKNQRAKSYGLGKTPTSALKQSTTLNQVQVSGGLKD